LLPPPIPSQFSLRLDDDDDDDEDAIVVSVVGAEATVDESIVVVVVVDVVVVVAVVVDDDEGRSAILFTFRAVLPTTDDTDCKPRFLLLDGAGSGGILIVIMVMFIDGLW
jgi:hypothetical protein